MKKLHLNHLERQARVRKLNAAAALMARVVEMKQILACLFATLLLVGCSDPNEKANQVFQVAQKQIKAAETLKPDDALANLIAAQHNLKLIVDRFPSSDIAVRLRSGEAIGTVSLAAVAKAIAEARQAKAAPPATPPTVPTAAPPVIPVTTSLPSKNDVLAMAVKAARLIKDDTAGSIYSRDTRSYAYAELAEAQSAAGQIAAALKTAGSVKGDLHRSVVFMGVAEGQAAAGQMEAALKTAQSIKDDYTRSLALVKIATAEAALGRKAEASENMRRALKAAQSMKSGSIQLKALIKFARVKAAMGHKAEASDMLRQVLKTAQSTIKNFELPNVLLDLAKAHGAAGRKAKASDLLRRAVKAAQGKYVELHSAMFSHIAGVQAGLGEIDAAMKTAKSATYHTHRFQAYIRIAAAQAKAGHRQAALKTAQSIKYTFERSQALISIAAVEQAAGRKAEAASLMNRALKMAAKITNHNRRLRVFLEIVRELPK